MPLRLVADDLDDLRHEELDRLAFQSLGGLTPQLLPRFPPELVPAALWKIIKPLSGKLDEKFGNANTTERLIEEFPALNDSFQEAWSSGTFRSIRNLGTL
jgi:hypothetical protein